MWGCEHDGKCRFFVAGNSQPLREGEIQNRYWNGKDGVGTYKKNTKSYWKGEKIYTTTKIRCHVKKGSKKRNIWCINPWKRFYTFKKNSNTESNCKAAMFNYSYLIAAYSFYKASKSTPFSQLIWEQIFLLNNLSADIEKTPPSSNYYINLI